MEYINLFGFSYNKQLEAYEKAQDDVFFRKISILTYFSEELKKKNITFSIATDPDSSALYFKFDNGLPSDYPRVEKNTYSLLMNEEKFGLNSQFFEKHNITLNIILHFEDLLRYENLKNIKYPDDVIIDKNDTLWIKLICDATENSLFYTKFLHKVLDKNINKNKQRKQKLLKI